MTFYDSHLHAAGEECGGFVIGLEGDDLPKGVFRNQGARQFCQQNEGYRYFRYLTRHDVCGGCALAPEECRFVKFHPRREGYGVEEVGNCIRAISPKCVIIDSLNEPNWEPRDYWLVCREFPTVKFVLAHAGGYSVRDFVKICHIQRNVWLDFSLTHSCFASISDNPLPGVDDLILYSFRAPFSNRILMGSDFPYNNQHDVASYYAERGLLERCNENFRQLCSMIE